jgi:hypothetical protein
MGTEYGAAPQGAHYTVVFEQSHDITTALLQSLGSHLGYGSDSGCGYPRDFREPLADQGWVRSIVPVSDSENLDLAVAHLRYESCEAMAQYS